MEANEEGKELHSQVGTPGCDTLSPSSTNHNQVSRHRTKYTKGTDIHRHTRKHTVDTSEYTLPIHIHAIAHQVVSYVYNIPRELMSGPLLPGLSCRKVSSAKRQQNLLLPMLMYCLQIRKQSKDLQILVRKNLKMWHFCRNCSLF